jgi:hypothetical protein
MTLRMCIQHGIQILVLTLSSKKILVAHSIVIKKIAMGSVYTEEFNTGQGGGGLNCMMVIDGGLKRGSPGPTVEEARSVLLASVACSSVVL